MAPRFGEHESNHCASSALLQIRQDGSMCGNEGLSSSSDKEEEENHANGSLNAACKQHSSLARASYLAYFMMPEPFSSDTVVSKDDSWSIDSAACVCTFITRPGSGSSYSLVSIDEFFDAS